MTELMRAVASLQAFGPLGAPPLIDTMAALSMSEETDDVLEELDEDLDEDLTDAGAEPKLKSVPRPQSCSLPAMNGPGSDLHRQPPCSLHSETWKSVLRVSGTCPEESAMTEYRVRTSSSNSVFSERGVLISARRTVSRPRSLTPTQRLSDNPPEWEDEMLAVRELDRESADLSTRRAPNCSER